MASLDISMRINVLSDDLASLKLHQVALELFHINLEHSQQEIF